MFHKNANKWAPLQINSYECTKAEPRAWIWHSHDCILTAHFDIIYQIAL